MSAIGSVANQDSSSDTHSQCPSPSLASTSRSTKDTNLKSPPVFITASSSTQKTSPRLIKPIYKKFCRVSFDRTNVFKIFKKEGKYFIVRYSRNGGLELFANNVVSQQLQPSDEALKEHRSSGRKPKAQNEDINSAHEFLIDVSESLPEIRREFLTVFSSVATFGEGRYTFELLYSASKKEITVIDLFEYNGHSLNDCIYGKRLGYLKRLDFLRGSNNGQPIAQQASKFESGNELQKKNPNKSTRLKIKTLSPEPDALDEILAKPNRRRTSFWIRNLSDLVDHRVFYAYKDEIRSDMVTTYAVVGSAFRVSNKARKKTPPKARYDYTLLSEVPKEVLESVKSILEKEPKLKEDFVKQAKLEHENLRGQQTSVEKLKLDLINKLRNTPKYSDFFKDPTPIQTEEIKKNRVLLVAGRPAILKAEEGMQTKVYCLEIFGYSKSDVLAKKSWAMLEEASSTEIPSYLTWKNLENDTNQFENIKYFNGISLATFVVPEKYNGRILPLICTELHGNVKADDFLNDTELTSFVNIGDTPAVFVKPSSAQNESPGDYKNITALSLSLITDEELLQQLEARVQSRSAENARLTTLQILTHIAAIGSFLSGDIRGMSVPGSQQRHQYFYNNISVGDATTFFNQHINDYLPVGTMLNKQISEYSSQDHGRILTNPLTFQPPKYSLQQRTNEQGRQHINKYFQEQVQLKEETVSNTEELPSWRKIETKTDQTRSGPYSKCWRNATISQPTGSGFEETDENNFGSRTQTYSSSLKDAAQTTSGSILNCKKESPKRSSTEFGRLSSEGAQFLTKGNQEQDHDKNLHYNVNESEPTCLPTEMLRSEKRRDLHKERKRSKHEEREGKKKRKNPESAHSSSSELCSSSSTSSNSSSTSGSSRSSSSSSTSSTTTSSSSTESANSGSNDRCGAIGSTKVYGNQSNSSYRCEGKKRKIDSTLETEKRIDLKLPEETTGNSIQGNPTKTNNECEVGYESVAQSQPGDFRKHHSNKEKRAKKKRHHSREHTWSDKNSADPSQSSNRKTTEGGSQKCISSL